MKLNVRHHFFNSGKTEILDERNHAVGAVDLRSAFGSALGVYGLQGRLLYGWTNKGYGLKFANTSCR